MKKTLKILLILLLMFVLIGCGEEEVRFTMDIVSEVTINVGEKLEYTLTNPIDTDIIEVNENEIIAKKTGYIVINTTEGEILIKVVDDVTSVDATAKLKLDIDEQTTISSTVYPTVINQEVTYKSSDTSILTVSSAGVVTGIDCGIAKVTVSSVKDSTVTKELVFFVGLEDEAYYAKIVNNVIEEIKKENNLDNIEGIIQPLIAKNASSVVGVRSYKNTKQGLSKVDFASGAIYRLDAILVNEEVVQRVSDVTLVDNISKFRYYVITNRHIIEDADVIKIYLGSDTLEVDATLVEYDTKIDLAVLTFESREFYPSITIGNSELNTNGEFIISIGNGTDGEYFKSVSFGIISYNNRYINDDTDGDNVNDWDAQYIQHDASINNGDSGGIIVNMKGEVVGINTTKISALSYNNMSFAIPINVTMEIVSQLEEGIRPQRALLGVEILDLKNYHENRDYYHTYYPNVVISEDITFGFYVNSITPGGVAEAAKVQIGDIIVEFNGVETRYSYQIRAELGKFLIGSGETAEIKVIRNNEVVTLTVTF